MMSLKQLFIWMLFTLLCFGLFYGCTAFVVWDANWLNDIGAWKAPERLGVLYGMGIIPAVVGTFVAVFMGS